MAVYKICYFILFFFRKLYKFKLSYPQGPQIREAKNRWLQMMIMLISNV